MDIASIEHGSPEWEAMVKRQREEADAAHAARVAAFREYQARFATRADGVVARWETRGGASWVELRVGPNGYGYANDRKGGPLPQHIVTDADAIEWMLPGTRPDWIDWHRAQVQAGNREGCPPFLPDAAKVPMKRVDA